MARQSVSRRDLLRGAAAGAAVAGFPFIVPARVLGRGGQVAPSNRIVMGCIGVGGQGTGIMSRFMGLPEIQVVAVCDVERESNLYYGGGTFGRDPAKRRVEEHYAKDRPANWKGCEAYTDLRELLARQDIDAVTVCTPDHWHAVACVAAARAGKDIYCEKPLANSVAEGRAIVEAVRAGGRVLQTGSHERSGDRCRYACELVRNGRLGKIHTVRINLPCADPHHLQVRKMNNEPQPPMPVPETLDWNMWLGPAPDAEYTKNRCHFFWRFILAHGAGEMSDRGAHVIDIAQLGLGMDAGGPVEVQASGKRDGQGPFDVFWDYTFECQYPGGVRMIGEAKGPRGLKFEGDNGWIFIHIHGGKLESGDPKLVTDEAVNAWAQAAPNASALAASAAIKTPAASQPATQTQSAPAGVSEPNEIRLGKSPGHQKNLIECIQQRKDPVASCEVGHRTATICHLANIAMIVGKPFKWDPVAQKSDSEEANRLLAHSMRPPWTV